VDKSLKKKVEIGAFQMNVKIELSFIEDFESAQKSPFRILEHYFFLD